MENEEEKLDREFSEAANLIESREKFKFFMKDDECREAIREYFIDGIHSFLSDCRSDISEEVAELLKDEIGDRIQTSFENYLCDVEITLKKKVKNETAKH